MHVHSFWHGKYPEIFQSVCNSDSEADTSAVYQQLSETVPDRRSSWRQTEVNRYLLVGGGSSGDVWWARHMLTLEEVAIKMPKTADHDKLKTDYQLQAQCRHRHVAEAKALLISPEGKYVGIVMEQCVCSLEDAVYNAQSQQQHQQHQQQQLSIRESLDAQPSLPRIGSGVSINTCTIQQQSEQEQQQQQHRDSSLAQLRVRVSCFSRRLHLLAQVAEALEHVHTAAGSKCCVLHNDVRAANVLLDFRPDSNSQGYEAVAKLADFGNAVQLQHEEDRVLLPKATNPLWAAPEAYWSQEHKWQQAPHDCRATLKSDVFSFGQLMHEVIAGVVPYTVQKPVPLDKHESHICGLVDQLWTHHGRHEWQQALHGSWANILQHCRPELRPQLLDLVPATFSEVFESCRNLQPNDRPSARTLREKLKLVAEQYAASLQEQGHDAAHAG